MALWHCGSITLAFFTPRTKMNRLFDKKSKKSPKYSQRDIFPGILTNTAVVPLGFRAGLNIAPKGERNRSIGIWAQIGLIRPWNQMKRTAGVRGSYFKERPVKIRSFPRRKPSVTPTGTNTAHQVSVPDPRWLG